MTKAYSTITRRIYDLDGLNKDERQFLDDVFALYRSGVSWDEFSQKWLELAREGLWQGKTIPVGQPVYRICQDLEARIGISEGRIAPPDYRDRLADLIEERFRSRYEFCKAAGIDQAHLSRVLAGKKHFAPETLFKILEVLGIELQFVSRKELLDTGIPQPSSSATDELIERVRIFEHKVARLEELHERARYHPPDRRKRLMGHKSLVPDDLDDLRDQVDRGGDVLAILESALREARLELANAAQQLAEKTKKKAATA